MYRVCARPLASPMMDYCLPLPFTPVRSIAEDSLSDADRCVIAFVERRAAASRLLETARLWANPKCCRHGSRRKRFVPFLTFGTSNSASRASSRANGRRLLRADDLEMVQNDIPTRENIVILL